VQQIGGRWRIVFDRVSEESFVERMREDPTLVAWYLEIPARLQARIHTYPASQVSSLKAAAGDEHRGAKLFEDPRRHILLSRLADMPDGDPHVPQRFPPDNVSGQASDPVVIDWPNAGRGDPVADV
jgi:hypothetical protein